jgi:hypothetical protein
MGRFRFHDARTNKYSSLLFSGMSFSPLLLLISIAVTSARVLDYKATNVNLASGVVEVVRLSFNCGPYLDGNALCKLMLAEPPFNHNVRFQSTFSAYFAMALRATSTTIPICRVWALTRVRVHGALQRILKRYPQPGVVLPPLSPRALELGEEKCAELNVPPLDAATWAALRLVSKFYSTVTM